MNSIFQADSSVPLYRQLAEELRRMIVSGELKPGQKLKSESEMIKEYGVGRLTVRNALALLVAEGILTKVQGKGTFLAENVRAKEESLNIQVFLDMSDTYFIPYYVRGISEVLSRSGSNFLISDTKDDDAVLCGLLENLTRKNTSGVIFQCTDECLSDAVSERIRRALGALSEAGIPVIIIDGRLPELDISSLSLDESSGGLRAAEHLAAFGHKKCAVISMESHRDSRLRKEGFQKGAGVFGMEVPFCIDALGDWETGLQAAVRNGVTGVFAFNDDTALRCVMALKKSGYSVPEDVSVIGFDDTYLAAACNPQLTSLVHPKEKMGADAAELMLSMIRNGSVPAAEKIYKTELVMRASCGPARRNCLPSG